METNQLLQEILQTVNQLKHIPSSSKYESDDIKDLAAAFAKAQGEYEIVGYNRDNPYFKSRYADLDAIIQSTRKALTKHGLAFTQQLRSTDEGAMSLHSRLMHASGQWIESRVRIIPIKNDPQTFGSLMTYYRRYTAGALLGVTIDSDMDDDDGEKTMTDVRHIAAKGTSLNTKYNPKENSIDTITKEQIEQLEYELGEYPDIGEQVLNGLRIQSLADMPKSKFQVSINRIRSIKNAREGIQ
jgi:hypothetical protein